MPTVGRRATNRLQGTAGGGGFGHYLAARPTGRLRRITNENRASRFLFDISRRAVLDAPRRELARDGLDTRRRALAGYRRSTPHRRPHNTPQTPARRLM